MSYDGARVVGRGGLRTALNLGAIAKRFTAGRKRLFGKKRGKRSQVAARTPNLAVTKWNQQSTNFFPRAGVSTFPQRKVFQLNYQEKTTVSWTTGGISSTPYVLSLNDLYDPNKSGGGHQPMGFDQITGMWKRYKVFKTEVFLDFGTPSVASVGAYGIAQIINPANYGTAAAGFTPSQFIERPGAATIRLLDNEESHVITGTFDICKIGGAKNVNDPQWSTNFTGSDAGGPASQVCLHITTCNDTADNTGSVDVRIRVCYHAMFYSPQLLAQS